LQGRVNSVLKVTKEGGFTSYAFVDNAGWCAKILKWKII
jgi:hypothetical protein